MSEITINPELLKSMGMSQEQIDALIKATQNTCKDFVLVGQPQNRYHPQRISPDYARRIRAERREVRVQMEEIQRVEHEFRSFSLAKNFATTQFLQLPAPVKPTWDRGEIKLLPYQSGFVEFAVAASKAIRHNSRGAAFKQKGVYLQDETGLGKTFQAIEAAIRVQDANKSTQPILIVCPKRAVSQWARQLKRYVPNAVIRREPIESDKPYFIVTWYENLRKQFPVKKNSDGQNSLKVDDLDFDDDDDMFDNPWDITYACVIADESHKLRDTGTQTWKAFNQVSFDFLIALSATPYHRDPAQMYPLLHKMQPAVFTSQFNYQARYTKYNGIKPAGIRNHTQFVEDHAFVLRKRTKAMVRPDHPDDFEEEVILDMTEPQKEFYIEIKDHRPIISDYDETDIKAIANVLAEMMRAQQCTSMPSLLKRSIDSAKMEWFRDWADDIIDNTDEDDKPIRQYLVFTKFVGTAQEIANILTEKGEAVALLTGETEGDVAREFAIGKVRWLVSTLASGSTALDFREMPKVDTVFYDMDWSFIKMKQAIGRTSGVVSPEPRTLTYVMCKGTIDEIVYSAFKDGVVDQETFVRRLLESNNW